jgi:acetolactate decarboxylase
MVRPITRRVLALVLFAAAAAPVRASEVYQISTISSLLAGGYDGDTTVGELIRHGGFGLGTFNGVDGEMMGRSSAARSTAGRMWLPPLS